MAFKVGSQVQIALSIKGQADPLTDTAQVARVVSFDSYFDILVAFFNINDALQSKFSKTLLQSLDFIRTVYRKTVYLISKD